jgi:hypothetical protein
MAVSMLLPILVSPPKSDRATVARAPRAIPALHSK